MGLGDKLANAWYIFTTSLSFIGRDKSLLIVPILMILSAVGIFAAFLLAFLMQEPARMTLFAIIVLFFIGMQFWMTFLSSAQAWMVYEVAQGRDTTLWSGLKRAFVNILDIVLFSIVVMLIKVLTGKLRQKGGAGRLAGGFLDMITGIAGKLVLPAMIVTDRSFFAAIKQLKDALPLIPEIAAFEIGIQPITGLVTFIGIIFSVLLGLAFGVLTGVAFLFLIILVVIIFSTLINQIYYTLLYLTLIEGKKVPGLKLTR